MADLNCILVPLKRRFLFFTINRWELRPSVAHLLHLIVKIKTHNIQKIVIHNNLIPLPKPYAAITFGRKTEAAHISFSKSFFKQGDLTMNDITLWVEILTHEVTHIKQIKKYRFFGFGLLPYLLAHAYHYIKAKSHDKSDLEQEPVSRQKVFCEMNSYLNKAVEPYALAKLFADETLTEREKISRINDYSNKYKASLNTDIKVENK